MKVTNSPPKATILIVDDEITILETLADLLEDKGYIAITAENGESAIKKFSEHHPDLVLLDVKLPDKDGIEVLKAIKSLNNNTPVIMISGHGTIEMAVKALKIGAYNFLEKPPSEEKIMKEIENALEKQRLEQENIALKRSIYEQWELIGESPAMKHLKEEISRAAASDGRVLIFGESGTGKELVARALHNQSNRKNQPFIEVNCAAIPLDLIESELFGHEKGSFTGALESRKGKFELAHGGTLFLDEIGDMSLTTQAKVLRVIETQEFQRVGGNRKIRVDVRIIAATNKNLEEEIKNGRFREDLFFRLNVIPIRVPPLRERKEDIPLLVNHFLRMFARQYGQKVKSMSQSTLKALMEYHWPGNVRELKNTIERFVIMSPSDVIEAVDFGPAQVVKFKYTSFRTLREAREQFERDFITQKLRENNWNISKTADELEIERSNLHRKIKALGIEPP